MSDQFDPKAYLAQKEESQLGGFDPKAYLAQGNHEPDVMITSDSSKAALDHFSNAASMGYLPQLQAAASKLVPDPNAGLDDKLRGQGFNVVTKNPSYVEERDQNIANLNREGQEHPVASALGTVGGVLSGGAGLGAAARGVGLAAKSAQFVDAAKAMGGAKAAMAARLGVAGVTGAGMAAAANPGDTEGEIDPIQFYDRADNAKTGAIVGTSIEGAIQAAPSVLNGIRFAGKKIASTLSGISSGDLDQYAKRTDQINDMIKRSGGDMTEAADRVREEAQNALRSTRQTYSAQIGNALKAAPKDPVADTQPIIDQLTAVKDRLNPNLKSDSVEKIQSIIDKVKKEGESNGGKVSIQQLNELTDYLQEQAKSAYMKGGQIFQNPKEAAQASKAAAAISRKSLNSFSPEIAEANNKLAYLHILEDKLNPNLIKPGSPDSALFSAGSGNNQRNAKVMDAIGEASGYPLLDKAKDLASARTFAKPDILPKYTTGKSAAGLLVAGGLAHMAGPLGYLAALPASPAAIKLGLNVANAFKGAGPAVQGALESNPAVVQRVAQSISTPPDNKDAPSGSKIDDQTLGIFKSNPDLIESIANPNLKNAIMKQIGRDPGSTPDNAKQPELKGEDKFAADGMSKLGLSDDSLLTNKEARALLLQAHSLPAGSKKLQAIKNQLSKGMGNK